MFMFLQSSHEVNFVGSAFRPKTSDETAVELHQNWQVERRQVVVNTRNHPQLKLNSLRFVPYSQVVRSNLQITREELGTRKRLR